MNVLRLAYFHVAFYKDLHAYRHEANTLYQFDQRDRV
jgi:hypothetical protein